MYVSSVLRIFESMSELYLQCPGSQRSKGELIVVPTFVQVASWGGDLLGRDILTVSLAPRDNHEAQVQFALERGIPAILGIISTQRLPYPAHSFDLAHCSRCLIPWTDFGNSHDFLHNTSVNLFLPERHLTSVYEIMPQG